MLCLLLLAAGEARSDESARVGDAWHDERNPIVQIFKGERLDLWSLRPIGQVDPPHVERPAPIRNPIDRFLLTRLAAVGRSYSPEADRRTLARRLSFDLTGLPPNLEQVERFLADDRLDAYERLVDELLASPGYGAHSTRLWLDVVRYSDSNGFDWDEFRRHAWRFRDYVIRSFNADKPFDQFVREQLAGDELVAGPPQSAADQDALIATTYLRLGPHDNAAGLFNEQGRSRSELLADLVETTGSAFLGLTMACCRCHDHKFDPLLQADHFRLRAFFEGVKFADDLPLNLAGQQQEIEKHNAEIDARVGAVEGERDGLKHQVRDRVRAPKIAALSDEERMLLATPAEQLADEQKKRAEELRRQVEPSDDEVKAACSDDETGRLQRFEEQIKTLREERLAFEVGLLMTDQAEEIAETHILYQGDYRAPRDVVVPGFLSALDPNPAAIVAPAHQRTKGRRLALANWIVSPENPLTARVLVNRLWQQHFGRGLVSTPNDFGLAGNRPTHPELLDYLARELMARGWSIKQMHRLIVTSAAYRQSSQRPPGDPDPENLLLGRQTLRRLSAEQLRDSLLSCSNLLVPATGGPPVWPELPPEILQANPAFLDDNATRTKGWYASPPEVQHVRSVYLVQKRTVKVPFLETFDLPENLVSCARRTTSIVAPQALSLLNSRLAVETGQALAARVKGTAGEDADRQIREVFRLALARAPRDDEIAACRAFLERRSLPELCRVLFNLNEFIFID
jgi:Protein of unknown function (DUF1553)/Protein of unknown function (DUF1549)